MHQLHQESSHMHQDNKTDTIMYTHEAPIRIPPLLSTVGGIDIVGKFVGDEDGAVSHSCSATETNLTSPPSLVLTLTSRYVSSTKTPVTLSPFFMKQP
mmetsp:Transcript_4476/g.9926  ORF Transcript_4476/g.9926 Transcript_4476/m.9926 type:complete len:98 (+) Transcript_4476:57-350(+)